MHIPITMIVFVVMRIRVSVKTKMSMALIATAMHGNDEGGDGYDKDEDNSRLSRPSSVFIHFDNRVRIA